MENDWKGTGIYRLSKSQGLEWVREGSNPFDARLHQDEILFANAPKAGVSCTPGAELGTIEGFSSEQIFNDKGSLSPLGDKIVSAAKKGLRL